MHKPDYTALAHPMYADGGRSMIGDEVLDGPGCRSTEPDPTAGVVVAIYLDGMVELSTGDQVPAADLVLLRRAER